eukprot:2185797-Prymnesium_polylepis.1
MVPVHHRVRTLYALHDRPPVSAVTSQVAVRRASAGPATSNANGRSSACRLTGCEAGANVQEGCDAAHCPGSRHPVTGAARQTASACASP